MIASIQADAAKGPGYGIIRVHLDSPDMLADTRFLILTPGRGTLGPDGWTESEYRQSAIEAKQGGPILMLYVGPDIVDHLSSGRTYFFSLAEGQRVPLQVEPGLMPSPGESRMGAAAPAAPAASAASETPVPEQNAPVAPADAETPPVEGEPSDPPVATVAPIEWKEPAVQERAAAQKAPAKKKPGQSGNKVPVVIAAILVLLLIALCAWIFLRSPGGGDERGGVTAPLNSQPLLEARALLARPAPPDELRAALERFSGMEGAEDAVFLLLEDLAEHDPALRLRYAAYFDPTDTRPTGSIEKDPEAALREYRRAQVDGALEAAEALRNLLTWAEEQAADGNPAAAQLLENW